MKNSIKLLILSAVAAIGLQCITACSDSKETATSTETKEDTAPGKVNSIFGKNAEEKVDAFLTDYLADLKAAVDEKDDAKAITMLQEMKKEYAARAKDLKPEVEAWQKSLSAADEQELEKRAESKPYIKDLITIGFTASGRFNKNPELQKAFDELNDSLDNLDINNDQIEEEEYPRDEDTVGEEETEEDENQ